MKRALLLSSIAALLALPSVTEAQCAPDAVFCAEVDIQVGGGAQPAPPAQPPPPAPVYVQPAPPPQPPPAPPAQPQYVQPQYAQPIVYESTAPRPPQAVRPYRFSLMARFGGGGGSESFAMGGDLGFRFRPSRVFGIQALIGHYNGTDDWDTTRSETPVTFDFLFFLNRSDRFQFFLSAGAGVSFTTLQTGDWDTYYERDFLHVGVQGGAGMEWRFGRRFAMSATGRIILREALGSGYEFRDDFTGRETNTSIGALFNVGFHFYMGRR